MLEPIYTKSFRKEFKLMEKRRMNIDKLRKVVDIIINEQTLPPERCNHPLHGKWEGSLECHVEPDWLLIYRIYKEKNEVVFYHTGSHSDLY